MAFYLGLDAGGTNLAAGVVDQDGVLYSRETISSEAGRPIEEIVERMVCVSHEAVKRSGVPMTEIRSWGIGMPSCINAKTQRLVHANCFGWKDVPIYNYLLGKLPLTTIINNDANCAVLGELYAGAAKGYQNVILLTLGTGLGSGIIINGELFTGADGMGAEFGHTKVVPGGRQCTCGQHGCADVYCSATGIILEARELLPHFPNSLLASKDIFNAKDIFVGAKVLDSCCMQAVDHYITYLALVLSNIIPVFRPEIILLGGGVAGAGESLLAPLREKTLQITYGADVIGIPEIQCASLGNDAGIIGAAFLGRRDQL